MRLNTLQDRPAQTPTSTETYWYLHHYQAFRIAGPRGRITPCRRARFKPVGAAWQHV